MISQVVFDLPLEGSFDYLVPTSLEKQISIGMCVEVFLGTKKRKGLIVALKEQSAFESLKAVKSILGAKPILDEAQIDLGYMLSAYYGCSLGEALFTIVRGAEEGELSLENVKRNNPSLSLYIIPSGDYAPTMISLIVPLAAKKQRVLVLVADQFMASWIDQILRVHFLKEDYLIGTRSAVFRSLADIALVIIIDEDNPSFKQEQMPMYETREVLLMRTEKERIDIAFISATPSPELIFLLQQGKIKGKEISSGDAIKTQAIDLTNYKFTPKGLVSIPIKNAIEKNLASKQKTILVLNRKGSYALSRCMDCGFILKCERCDAPMMFSRTKGGYFCHYCNFTMPQDSNCPICKKPSWKSVGIGVEQLHRELKNMFPQASVICFERSKNIELKNFEILITTQAVLRFRQQLKVNSIALIDIDSQLNRMDTRSSFRAWSLVSHLRNLAKEQMFIQTRNPGHYVVKSLIQNDPKVFYDEDMSIRRELKLSPFGHDITISLRSKNQDAAQKMAQELYDQLKEVAVCPPNADIISKKRDQFRFTFLLKGDSIIAMMRLIKKALIQIKRNSKVIVTWNVE